MDLGTSSHYNAYHEQTVMNTIESNDETVIGGLSQGDDAAKLRALYPTERGFFFVLFFVGSFLPLRTPYFFTCPVLIFVFFATI